MKKYIKPTMECRQAQVESLLDANSLPVSDTTVPGGNALSKHNLWDDEEE